MRRFPGFVSRSIVAGMALAAFAVSVQAAPEYSADVIQKSPQGQPTQGKVYVSNAGMRTEFSQQGQQMIQIVNYAQGSMWMVYPDQKSYMERKGAGGGPGASAKRAATDNPCAGIQGASCKNLGTESVAGRPAVKWEMVGQQQGKTMRSVMWLDSERGFPLRQEMPDGGKSETRMAKTESYEGRQVEVWETVMTDAKGQTQRSESWFDPQLEVAVRESFPGGHGRELHNIQVGAQPASLFADPGASGYKLIQIPSGGGQEKGSGGQQGRRY